MKKQSEENVTLILSELHNKMQNLVESNEFSNIELMTAVLNFLVESTALLELDEKITLDMLNKTFVKNVRKQKKYIEKAEKATQDLQSKETYIN
jgi:hypothetical protein